MVNQAYLQEWYLEMRSYISTYEIFKFITISEQVYKGRKYPKKT